MQYEFVLVVNSLITDENLDGKIEKFKAIIENDGNKVLYSTEWGRRRLAYPLKKFNRGYYHIFYFEGNGSVIPEIGKQVGYDDDVLLHMITKVKNAEIAHKNFLALKENPLVNVEKLNDLDSLGE